MTHKEITMNTKIAFADALKKLLVKKQLNKIAVTDIVKECNVNRNTFYYHFADIYELFQWTLEYESFDVIKKFDLAIDFEESVVFTIQYIKSNQYILNSVYDTLGQDQLKKFLKHDFESVTKTLIESTAENYSVHVSEEYKEFLVQFYSSAIASIMISYICGEMDFSDEQLVKYLSDTIQKTLPAALGNN